MRSYPTHGAQISSLSLRPITQGTDKEPEKKGANGDALPHVSVNVGPNFFKADRDPDGDAAMADSTEEKKEANGEENGDGEQPAPAESEKDAAGENDDADSLFDDDAEGEDESKPATPALQALGLALPGAKQQSASATPAPAPAPAPKVTKPTAKLVAGAAASIPLLSPAEYKTMSNDILLTSSMDGQVTLFDRREGGAVGRLVPGERAPPWCMSVSPRRGGTGGEG